MSNYQFQLYKSKVDNFPSEIQIKDEIYPIQTNFKDILYILKSLEEVSVPQEIRNINALLKFYPKAELKFILGQEVVTNIPERPFFYFEAFVKCMKEPEASNKPPVMDLFFDADVIYTSFKMQYGIDLIDAPYMHWFEFKMLLDGLHSDTPLQERIKIRTAKIDGLKGEDLENLKRAKRLVALPNSGMKQEQQLILKQFGIEV